MPVKSGVCVVCQEPGTSFHHFNDEEQVAVIEQLGYKADDNYCDQCYDAIVGRRRDSEPPAISSESQSVLTIDAFSQGTPQPSQRGEEPRLSEMPLPISPPGRSPSGSSSRMPLDDTVDRMVAKKRRISKNRVDQIASQSLSLDDVNISSQDVTKAPRRPIAEKQPRGSPKKTGNATVVRHSSDDSSLEELQIPPMPKNRRTRPGHKQFANGSLEFPSYIHTHVISSDLPRVAAG